MDAITCNQCVLVIGEAGCGKSTTVKYVADSFIQRQTNYMIKIITTFIEIDPDPSQKTLYIFYDAFGVFSCDKSFTDVLEHYRDIELLLKRKQSKLIMTSRSSVYKKLEKFSFSNVVCVIDLNYESLTLSDNERMNIYEKICCPTLEKHLTLAVKCKHASFPLLCTLFLDFPELHESPIRFFENPIDTFLHFLNYFKETNTLTYCLLVCVAMHGKIDCPLDSNQNSPRNLELALQEFQQGCSSEITKTKLVEKFKEFVKETRWFIQLKESNFYSFRHKFLHEMVAYHYGQSHVDGLLAVMGSNFISEKIKLGEGKNINTNELVLYTDVISLEKRLFLDIHNYFNYFHVFTNKCWKDISFCNAFRNELKESERSDIADLFWKCKNENRSSQIYKIGLCKKKEKNYISLKTDDYEWFRHKLLEDRTEMVSESEIKYEMKIKAVSWVFGFGIHQILPYLLTDQTDAKEMPNRWKTGALEKIRFLILSILSQSLDCFLIALNLAGGKCLNNTCSSNNIEHDTRNKHRNFTPLTAACYKGFSEAIKELVNKGSYVNCMDKNGSKPLVLACRYASFSDCTYLIEKGAELCCTSGNGITPLIAAVMRKNTNLVHFLLTRSIDVNQSSLKGKSPLYYAAKRGSLDILRLLIDKKAYINKPDIEGRTPLYWASQNKFYDIVDYLISKEANVNQCDRKEKSPLYCASKRGHLNIVKLLLNNGADVNKSTLHNKSSLYRAVKRGHFEICKVLIEKGGNVNKTDWEGNVPLYWAAKREHKNILNLLLEYKALPNNRNDKGKTALHCAAQAGRVDIAKCLVDKEADVHIEDLRKRTPLYCASKQGHVDMVIYLINRGSDRNIKTTIKSKSAVLPASKRNHRNVLKALLSKSVDVNITDDNGVTPLQFAAQLGHLEIVKILVDAGAEVNSSCGKEKSALCLASQAGEYSIVKHLLENGANVNQKENTSGNTALICASEGGYMNIVRLLLKKGADVNIKNVENQTPIHFASKGNHLSVIRYLIEENAANVNVQDKNGDTALHWAAKKGYFDLVNMLCENRCNVNDYNQTKEQTPIYLAAKYGHIDIVKHLLGKGANKNICDKYGYSHYQIAKQMGHVDICDILS